MNYYEELVRQIDKSMKAHPRSTVVMDSGSFKIIAAGRNTRAVARKLKRTKPGRGTSVVFKGLDKKAVWILATHPAP